MFHQDVLYSRKKYANLLWKSKSCYPCLCNSNRMYCTPVQMHIIINRKLSSSTLSLNSQYFLYAPIDKTLELLSHRSSEIRLSHLRYYHAEQSRSPSCQFLDSCFERFARGIFRSVVSFLSTELARFAQQIGLDKTEVMDE